MCSSNFMDLSIENRVLLLLLGCYSVSVGVSGFWPRDNLLTRLEFKESHSPTLLEHPKRPL